MRNSKHFSSIFSILSPRANSRSSWRNFFERMRKKKIEKLCAWLLKYYVTLRVKRNYSHQSPSRFISFYERYKKKEARTMYFRVKRVSKNSIYHIFIANQYCNHHRNHYSKHSDTIFFPSIRHATFYNARDQLTQRCADSSVINPEKKEIFSGAGQTKKA